MTLTLKIQLRGIKQPPVWRRIEIPASFTFHHLHETIQEAFDWWDYHLYQFEKSPFDNGWTVKVPDESDEEYGYDITDSKKTLVSAFLRKMGLKKFVYVYDFGDSWVHDITVEAIDEKTTLPHPVCLAGKGAAPHEDCGGVDGYEEIKRLFAEDPDGEETREYRQWLGLEDDEDFDPKQFDIDELNERLEGIQVRNKLSEAKAWKKLTKSVTLIDTMKDLSKGDIMDYAEDLHLKINTRLSLEKMKQAYAKAILDNPLKVLRLLPLEDLSIIEKLKEGKDGPNVVDVYSDYREYLLVYYGLADEIVDNDHNHYLRFGDDFRDAVTPLISAVMDDELVHCRVTIESYVEGLANLYGQVSRRQVKETLVRFHQARDLENAEEVLNMTHLISALFSWMWHESAAPWQEQTDDTYLYLSRYGWDKPKDLEREQKKFDLKPETYILKAEDFREFSEMEILAAARSPIPLIPNPKQEAFARMLTDDLGMNEWEVIETCHDLWYRAMHDGEGDETLEQPEQFFIDFVLDTIDASPKEREKALTSLTDYLNNMPYWQMRGFTPNDNMKRLGIKQPSATRSRRPMSSEGLLSDFPWSGGLMQPFVAPKKVGRNDPCPCGSGKKYKHCCGRGN